MFYSGQRTIYRAVQMQALVNYLGKESSPGCVSGASMVGQPVL